MDTAVEDIIASNFPEVERRESIVLISEPCVDSDITVGQSKFGGAPDMTREIADVVFQSPCDIGFIAQLNFAEIKQFDPVGLLPADGLLVLFLTVFPEVGPILISKYYEPNEKVERIALPANVASSAPCRISFERWMTVPRFASEDLVGDFDDPDNTDVDDEIERYDEMLNELDGEFLNHFYSGKDQFDLETPRHQMFGFHSDVECTKRKPGGDEKWHLFAQFGSDARTKFVWGNGGQLYLWIREADLLAKDFKKMEVELVK